MELDAGNVTWVLVSSALVLFMTPGLAFFYGGMDRSRNVLNMLMMNFWALLVVPDPVGGRRATRLAFAGSAAFIGDFDCCLPEGHRHRSPTRVEQPWC